MAKKQKLVEPPVEQFRKCRYEPHNLTEKGQIVGRVYRRQPIFETMFLRREISREEVQALRYYRERYETCHHSLTRSCLSPAVGSGSKSFGGMSPFSTRAAQEVQIMENAAGAGVHSLRSVAIEDMSFNKVAMERFGSKQVNIGGRERILPKSKQHSRKVRSEFFAALKCFLPAAQSFYVLNFFVDFVDHMGQKDIISGKASKQDVVTHIAPKFKSKAIA